MKRGHGEIMRKRIFLLLDTGPSDEPGARAVDIFLVSLISLNVIAVIFESMPEVYDAYGPWFDAFEIFSVSIFTIEYVARVWSAVESRNPRYKSSIKGRIRFMLSPLALTSGARLSMSATWGSKPSRTWGVLCACHPRSS